MIDKLEYFIALAQAQHFGRAADLCGISQPTLSAGLKQLEEQLGVLLVNRGSRFQGITPEGERVLDWARRIVADSRAMREEVRASRHGLAGQLRLAVIPSALPVVARLVAPFHQTHPEVNFTVLSRTSYQILDLMENLEVDIGMTYLDNEPVGQLRAVPLYREHYCLIVSRHSGLASRAALNWQEISGIPLCLLTKDMQNRRIIDRYLSAAGVTPQATLESNSMIVLLTHVQTGEWATIMPKAVAAQYGEGSTLAAIDISCAEVPMVGLVYPKREPLPPQTAAFVQRARMLAAHFSESP